MRLGWLLDGLDAEVADVRAGGARREEHDLTGMRRARVAWITDPRRHVLGILGPRA